jgi:hypothetical protein
MLSNAGGATAYQCDNIPGKENISSVGQEAHRAISMNSLRSLDICNSKSSLNSRSSKDSKGSKDSRLLQYLHIDEDEFLKI